MGSESCGGSFVGVHASSADGSEAPVRTEPLPTALIKRRSMLKQSFSSSSFSIASGGSTVARG
jgi:hypothetical protein